MPRASSTPLTGWCRIVEIEDGYYADGENAVAMRRDLKYIIDEVQEHACI